MKNKMKIVVSCFLLFIFVCQIFAKDITSPVQFKGDVHYNEYNLDLFDEAAIIIPKNQTEAQNLSIVVRNRNNELIVFDGGRIEDANFLVDVIKDNGGKVKSWYLTHIHDDHIGALYKILNDKNTNIVIENLFYNFAPFEWYYSKIGDDAGIVVLFENAVAVYNSSVDNAHKIKIDNKINRTHIGAYDNVLVEVLNDIYLLDNDSINNTSLVYKVNIEDNSMIILGDLGKEGGERLLKEISAIKLNADIVVLSHHGIPNISMDVYCKIKPKIAIWSTSKSIYENLTRKYDTNITKQTLNGLRVVYNFKSYVDTYLIK